jgi:hypothetical protein
MASRLMEDMLDNSAEFGLGNCVFRASSPDGVHLGRLASIGPFAPGMYPEQLMSCRRLHNITRLPQQPPGGLDGL